MTIKTSNALAILLFFGEPLPFDVTYEENLSGSRPNGIPGISPCMYALGSLKMTQMCFVHEFVVMSTEQIADRL